MKLTPLGIPEVIAVESPVTGDARGSFARLYFDGAFRQAGVDFTPRQISHSVNRQRGTLRGVHFQHPPHAETKLVRCLSGCVWDVALDLRQDSPSFGKWCATELRPETGRSILIPRGFGHGFITLEDNSALLYMTDHPWTPDAEGGARWDDPAFAINWPIEPTVLSERDRSHPLWPSFD